MAGKKSKKAETVYDAVEQQDFERLVELIAAGADVNESEEDTPLATAAEFGRADMVRELLKAGADPSFGGIWVPLCAAVRGKNPEVVKLLIDAKAEVDAQEEEGSTALMLAAFMGNLEIVKMLVAAGADPKMQDEEGQTAIVSGREWPEIVEFLKPLSAADDLEYIEKEKQPVSVSAEEFLTAVKSGEVAKVKEMISGGAPVTAKNKSDETALHFAAEGGYKEIAEALLKAGAVVDAKNDSKRTPLAIAARSGQVELAELLIAAGANLESRDAHGETPFLSSISANAKNRETMRFLAKAGAKIDAEDAYDRSALELASRELNVENNEFASDEKKANGRALRQTFIDIGLLHPEANQLMAEAEAGNIDAVRKRIESGVPVNVYDEQERTALYMAVSRHHHALVDYLLKAGADVHKVVGGDDSMRGKVSGPMFLSWNRKLNPLTVAARDGDVESAKRLLDAGADVNRVRKMITPLMAACYNGHLEMAKLLVARGAEVAREGKTPDRVSEKVTALSIASNGKFSELANWLMENGAPVKDRSQMALVDAARRGDATEIKKLLAAGAKPDQPHPLTKELPLDVAAAEAQGEAVAALLQAGAPIAIPRQLPALLRAVGAMEHKSRSNELDEATVTRYLDVVKQLLAAGAKPDARFFGFDAVSLAESIKCQPLIEVLQAAIPPKPAKKKKK